MICRECGASNEEHLAYCKVCAAPLRQDPSRVDDRADEGPSRSNWEFVRAPKWPDANFDQDDVTDEQATGSVAWSKPPRNQEYVPPTFRTREREQSYYEPEPNRTYEQPQEDPSYYDTDDTDPGYTTTAYQDDEAGVPYGNAQSQHYGGETYSFAGAQYDQPQQPYYRNNAQSVQAPNVRRYASPMSGQRPIADDERYGAYRAKQPAGYAKTHKGRQKSMLFWLIAAGLFVLIAVFGIIYITSTHGSLGAFFTGSPIMGGPNVSAGVDKYGEPAYLIDLRLKPGSTVELVTKEGVQTHVVSASDTQLRVPVSMLVPDEPIDGTTAEVKPELNVIRDDGKEFAVNMPAIPIEVPALTLSVDQGSSVKVTDGKLALSGKVDHADATVTIEGQALEVKEDGSFSGTYEIAQKGMYTYTVEAKKNGYQIAKSTIEVDYTQQDVPLDVDTTSLRVNDDGKGTIKGTVAPGATMNVSGPSGVTLGTPDINESSGVFTFTAEIAQQGSYAITFDVSKDGINTKRDYIVEFAPNYDEYTAKAFRMDYDRMKNEPAHTASYKCIGTVSEIVQEQPYVIAKLKTEDGDEMLFEYHGTTTVVVNEENKRYNVWADYKGIDAATGLPKVYCWFITKKTL